MQAPVWPYMLPADDDPSEVDNAELCKLPQAQEEARVQRAYHVRSAC